MTLFIVRDPLKNQSGQGRGVIMLGPNDHLGLGKLNLGFGHAFPFLEILMRGFGRDIIQKFFHGLKFKMLKIIGHNQFGFGFMVAKAVKLAVC